MVRRYGHTDWRILCMNALKGSLTPSLSLFSLMDMIDLSDSDFIEHVAPETT